MALSKCLNIWNNVWFQTFCWCCCLEIHDIDKRENESVISSMCDLIITNTYFFFSKDVCGSRQQMVFAQFSIYSNITLMKVSVVWFYDQISDPKKKTIMGVVIWTNRNVCLEYCYMRDIDELHRSYSNVLIYANGGYTYGVHQYSHIK